jgi:hypothetical protein
MFEDHEEKDVKYLRRHLKDYQKLSDKNKLQDGEQTFPQYMAKRLAPNLSRRPQSVMV